MIRNFLNILLIFALATAVGLLLWSYQAGAFQLPKEPPADQGDYWIPTPVGVEIWYAVDGRMQGFLHPVINHFPSKECREFTTQSGTISLLTQEANPTRYLVKKEATHFRVAPDPNWQPLTLKTYQGER